MKRWFFIVIGIYLIITLAFICFHQEMPDEVIIITIPQTEARLITSEAERMEIDVFVNTSQSFLTEKTNITSVKIVDSSQELAVAIHDITHLGPAIICEETLEHFQLILSFEMLYPHGVTMRFIDATLRLLYENQAEFQLAIGNITLMFADVSQEAYLDFSRLYGVTMMDETKHIMTGIHIEFRVSALAELVVESIDPLLEGVSFDLNRAHIPDVGYPHCLDVSAPEAVEAWPSAGEITDSEVVLISDALYYFPLAYRWPWCTIRRFPLVITYRYLETSYHMIIDDFRYYQEDYWENATYDDICRYSYQY